MKPFGIVQPETVSQACELLAQFGAKAKVLAGGTDLLYILKERMEGTLLPVPEVLIDISKIEPLHRLQYRNGKGVELGALTRLSELADGKLLPNYSILRQASRVIATPQIRNMATLGGNLCQRPWCWYFRGHYDCLKKGGTTCYAYYRDNRQHAILAGGPCYMVHPSDMAPALIAMKAEVKIVGCKGTKEIPMEDFFIRPSQDMSRENVLEPDEILTSVNVPEPAPNTRGTYAKTRIRGSWDFALTSAAVVVQLIGNRCLDCRIVLGGVAPLPYRSKSAEEALRGNEVSEKTIGEAMKASVKGIEPLKLNSYKVALVQGLLQEALSALAH